MSSTGFYRAFEDRHRGSRELIRQRLEAYRPFILPLLDTYRPAKAVDLGCGRGEWVELLQCAGFAPQGVDLDAGMLAACTERGLPAMQGDAIAHLKTLDDGSQCIVSGFHIAEHIPFDDLETLVKQALRVLKPGGLLILETPNPENLVVGACSFFLDPTHLRPIPPLLLSFLPEFHGFSRVRTVRLQESAELRARADIRMMEVLGGVSPDYAVVAQKEASAEVMARFDAGFSAPFGLELHELADRYDSALERRMNAMGRRLANAEAQAGGMTDALGRIATLQDRLLEVNAQLVRSQADCAHQEAEIALALQRAAQAQALATQQEQRAAQAEALATQQEQRAAQAEALATQQQERIDELGGNSHHWWLKAQQLEARVHELGGNSHHWWLQASALEAERNALRQSASWRITAPLRLMGGLVVHPVHTVRRAANHLIHGTINTFRHPLARLMAAVLRRPKLSQRIHEWLLRYPALYAQLLGVAREGGLVPAASGPASHAVQTQMRATPELANLSPRARQIYADLRTAAKSQNKSE